MEDDDIGAAAAPPLLEFSGTLNETRALVRRLIQTAYSFPICIHCFTATREYPCGMEMTIVDFEGVIHSFTYARNTTTFKSPRCRCGQGGILQIRPGLIRN